MSNRIDPDIEKACGPVSTLQRGNRAKQKGEVSATTRHAKELFMHGNGDGRPITNVLKLAEKSGAAVTTITRWMPVWERERSELAQAETAGKSKLVALVTGQTVLLQQKQVNRLKEEMERLESLLPTLPVGSEAHTNALRMYQSTVKAWTEQSGFAAYADLQATIAKEQVKLAARVQRSITDSDKPREVSGFAFDVQPSLPENSAE